jgi:hypothetical protein
VARKKPGNQLQSEPPFTAFCHDGWRPTRYGRKGSNFKWTTTDSGSPPQRVCAGESAAAEQSALSKGLVIEALIRLMRADWVEMSARTAGTLFRATPRGRENAFLDELPSFANPVTRWMTFVVDRVTGTTFRGRELPIFEMHVVRQREEKDTLFGWSRLPAFIEKTYAQDFLRFWRRMKKLSARMPPGIDSRSATRSFWSETESQKGFPSPLRCLSAL